MLISNNFSLTLWGKLKTSDIKQINNSKNIGMPGTIQGKDIQIVSGKMLHISFYLMSLEEMIELEYHHFSTLIK